MVMSVLTTYYLLPKVLLRINFILPLSTLRLLESLAKCHNSSMRARSACEILRARSAYSWLLPLLLKRFRTHRNSDVSSTPTAARRCRISSCGGFWPTFLDCQRLACSSTCAGKSFAGTIVMYVISSTLCTQDPHSAFAAASLCMGVSSAFRTIMGSLNAAQFFQPVIQR